METSEVGHEFYIMVWPWAYGGQGVESDGLNESGSQWLISLKAFCTAGVTGSGCALRFQMSMPFLS